MVANLGGLLPHFLVNPGRGCSSRSSLFVNRSNLSKLDLKRSVIRSEVRLAWFSDGPGRSRSRTLFLPRLMDFIQGRVRDVMTLLFFPPIRSNVTYSRKSGILGMYGSMREIELRESRARICHVCPFLRSLAIGSRRARASWRHEHDLEWSPSDGEGRECVTASALDRLRIRLRWGKHLRNICRPDQNCCQSWNESTHHLKYFKEPLASRLTDFMWRWGTPGRWGNPPSCSRKKALVYKQTYNPRVPGWSFLRSLPM